MTAIDKNSPPTATLLKEHCRYTGVPIGRKEKKNRRTREKLKCSDQSRLSPAQSEAAMFQMSFLNYLYLYIYIYKEHVHNRYICTWPRTYLHVFFFRLFCCLLPAPDFTFQRAKDKTTKAASTHSFAPPTSDLPPSHPHPACN